MAGRRSVAMNPDEKRRAARGLLSVGRVASGLRIIGVVLCLLGFNARAQMAPLKVLYSFGPVTNNGYAPMSPVVLSGGTLFGTTTAGGAGTNGTIYQAATDGTGFSAIHEFQPTLLSGTTFTNADGADIAAGLTLFGSRLFGVARNGGLNGAGTIFVVNTDGEEFTVMHTFLATKADAQFQPTNAAGANPMGDLLPAGGALYGTTSYGGTNGLGTVFSLGTNGLGFTVLHHFTNSEGAHPASALVLSGAVLYGAAQDGGSNYGSIFAISTNGSGFTNLHIFSGGNDGGLPASLTLADGTLIGTAAIGGSHGNGTIFRMNLDGGAFTNLHDFLSGVDGAQPLGRLVRVGDSLYGTTEAAPGSVFKLNTNGTGFKTLGTFTNRNLGTMPYAGLALLGTNLLGTASASGDGFGGTVFSISTNGASFTNICSFTNRLIGAQPSTPILAGGFLIGACGYGGYWGNGIVYQVPTNGEGFMTLHTFSDVPDVLNFDGANPTLPAGLAAGGGIAYGTTLTGGLYGEGNIFSINADGGGFQAMYNFGAITNDGSQPSGGGDPIRDGSLRHDL